MKKAASEQEQVSKFHSFKVCFEKNLIIYVNAGYVRSL